MLTSLYYPADGSMPEDIPAEQISEQLQKKKNGGVLWVDITQPTEQDFALLQSEFHAHPLAIEDLKQRDQRPKAVEYGETIFVVAHELRAAPDREDLGKACVERGAEIHAFVSSRFIVTVHQEDSEALKTARKRWEANTALQWQGPYYLLYLILDSLVDDYYPALDAYDERVDSLEQLVMQPANQEISVLDRDRSGTESQKPLQTLLGLRRNLLEMRRFVAPLRDAVNVLLRRVESLQRDDQAEPDKRDRARALFAYFQDVYDHTIRVVDTIDTYRDLLAGTLDAHLAVSANRLNEVVKVLTSVSIILMSWATITGVYGMNFVHMPELHWRYGYVYAWGLFLVTGVLEWIYFRRRKWL